MTQDIKMRRCVKCREEKPEYQFQRTPCPFFPSHRSIICTSCLETMVKQDNLGEVDRLMRYLDLPFDLNKWTQLFAVHKDHTLTAYFNLLDTDQHYESLKWADENERWRLAREEQTTDEQIAVLAESKRRKLQKEWAPTYTFDELLFLDNYYNQIISTQNASTPILQSRARDLCELTLRAKKGIREGIDVKKDLDAIDNIIKTCHFDASSAKNAADFESIGELMVYYGKKGWHPKWHTEPQDSIDFMMRDIQSYLRRLVQNEGNIAEQVEDRKQRYNLNERLEDLPSESDSDTTVEYEDEAAFDEEVR